MQGLRQALLCKGYECRREYGENQNDQKRDEIFRKGGRATGSSVEVPSNEADALYQKIALIKHLFLVNKLG